MHIKPLIHACLLLLLSLVLLRGCHRAHDWETIGTEDRLIHVALKIALWNPEVDGETPTTLEALHEKIYSDRSIYDMFAVQFEYSGVDRPQLLDRWGNEIVLIAVENQCVAVLSKGPDGKLDFGYGDDIIIFIDNGTVRLPPK